MEDNKSFIDDLGIDAFEANIKIAFLAVISNSGELIYQTENWDISNQTKALLNLIQDEKSIIIDGQNFVVVSTYSDGIIASSDSGMGHIILAPFQGGVLISYAMPQVDPNRVLDFLKTYTLRLIGKLKVSK